MFATLHVVESMLCSPGLPPYACMDLHANLLKIPNESGHPPQLQLLESKL